MKDFSGRIAVVTGGGTAWAASSCASSRPRAATSRCATSPRGPWRRPSGSAKTRGSPQGPRITTHVADVSDETQVLRFRDAVAAQHATDEIHLLFNNAGIGGGGSMITNSRDEWERTFNICWGGVYLSTRAFLPMLQKADEGHIVNTSSVNGFWASVGPGVPHTAYCAAKFAVKGFTEALITDLRINAPHIKCSVVMPGHIGTSIRSNSLKIQAGTRFGPLNPARSRSRVRGLRRRAGTLRAVRRQSRLSSPNARGVSSRKHRRPRPRRRRSFSTASKPAVGVFLSARTPT